jgi:hypothetical protein
MAADEAGALSRAIAVLFRPAQAWETIAAAPTPAAILFRRHVARLAAIPAICGVIGALIFGFSIANVGLRMEVTGLIPGALAGYAVTLAAVWLLAQWISLIAPAFGGERDPLAALNLVGYAATASWVAGPAELYPGLGIPVGVLAGLWSLYALYLGLPRLMRIPADRVLTAFAAVLIAILLLAALRGFVVSRTTELGGPLSASYAPR